MVGLTWVVSPQMPRLGMAKLLGRHFVCTTPLHDCHRGNGWILYVLLWKSWTMERYPKLDIDNGNAQRPQ